MTSLIYTQTFKMKDLTLLFTEYIIHFTCSQDVTSSM